VFGLGIWEIALLCIALLVFVRPEELPKVMGKLGQWYGRVTGSSRYLMRRLQEPFELDDEQAGGDKPEGGGNSIADNGARPGQRQAVPGTPHGDQTKTEGGEQK